MTDPSASAEGVWDASVRVAHEFVYDHLKGTEHNLDQLEHLLAQIVQFSAIQRERNAARTALEDAATYCDVQAAELGHEPDATNPCRRPWAENMTGVLWQGRADWLRDRAKALETPTQEGAERP